MRGSVGMRVVFSVTSFLWLWLAVAYSAAQCPSATFLPSDVMQNFDQNNVTDQLADQIATLKEKVPALFQRYESDVYAVAVVYGNRTIFSTGMVDTPFRIASITKVFTAMGALVLRQQGRLVLDDPVKKFLPTFSVINPYGKPHDITLRELMGHLSGLPRELCAGDLHCAPEDEEEILRFIAKMQLARPPWSGIPTYSNLGFAILGHAWEKATSPRQSWGEFVRNAISGPLEMHDTGLDLAHVKLAPGEIGPESPSNTSIGWVGPAGDMYSTALDLAKFLKFLLHPDEELLSEASIREWTKPTTLFSDAADNPSVSSGYALPWEIQPLTMADNQSTTLITKGGAIGTYLSNIAIHPASQLGVAVLTSFVNSTPNGVIVDPANITLEILQGLIPAVQSIHSKLISSMYSGVYTCKRSQGPILSPNYPNGTFQVLGGSINVPAMEPGKALLANWNISLVQDGEEANEVDSGTLVLKSAAEQSFWAYPEHSCGLISGVLSGDPEIARPNFPGSVYLYEFMFESREKVVRVPSVGAECYM